MSSFLYDFWDAITAVGVILGIIVSLIEIMHVLKVGDTDNNTKPINQSNEHENNRKKKTSNRAKADSSDKNKEVDNQAKRNINKNNNSSKKLVKVNAYTILAVLFFVFALYVWIYHDTHVRVPEIINMSINDAKISLSNAGLKMELIETQESELTAVIINQDPAPNKLVRKGSIVKCELEANSDRDDKEPKDVLIQESEVLVNEELEAYGGCKLVDGRVCILMSAKNEAVIPHFFIDVINGNKDILTLNDSDAVGVDLLEFIPYDELNIKESWGGADVWKEPLDFRINLENNEGIRYATPVIDGEMKESTGAYVKIPANDMQRLKLAVFPELKGYYRFKLVINYNQGGGKKTYESQEYHFVCTEGLNDNSTSEEQMQMGKNTDEEPIQTEQNTESNSVEYETIPMNQSTDWSRAYCSFIMSDEYLHTGQETNSEASKNYQRFSLHDMDDNGIPELLVFNGESMVDSYYYCYTYELNEDETKGIKYVGNLGFREGKMVYAPNSAYNGIYFQSGNMGFYSGVYYTLENGKINEETVVESTLPENATNSDELHNVQITDDDALYKTFVGWYWDKEPETMGLKTIPEFDKNTISEIGWIDFLKTYGY